MTPPYKKTEDSNDFDFSDICKVCKGPVSWTVDSWITKDGFFSDGLVFTCHDKKGKRIKIKKGKWYHVTLYKGDGKS